LGEEQRQRLWRYGLPCGEICGRARKRQVSLRKAMAVQSKLLYLIEVDSDSSLPIFVEV
jgi:hypothetical protein